MMNRAFTGMEATMEGTDVRKIFEAVLPEEALSSVIESAGMQERQRKLQALELVRAMVLASAAGSGGRQADVLRLYLYNGARRVTRCSFYSWFTAGLETAMAAVRERALSYVATQKIDLPAKICRQVRDWHIVDSTTVQLADELKGEYPGTGDYAALKVHKRYSVGIGTTVEYHLSPAREHDSLHLKIDESWRGLGLLCDLGYASFQRLLECEEHGVKYVMRLKENWKPKVQRVVRGAVSETFVPGMDFDLAIDIEDIELGGKIFDADVRLGSVERQVAARMIGIPTPKGYLFYLTNTARSDLAPRMIADLYRVRWEIESDNKLDKSGFRLDDINAQTGAAVRALVDASIVSSILICLLVHRHRAGLPRSKPPLHPQLLAKQMAIACFRAAAAMSLEGKAAKAEWDFLAGLFSYHTDPNWRRRPSVLDQLRGWKIIAVKRKTKSHNDSDRLAA
jgi:hypothetical protein